MRVNICSFSSIELRLCTWENYQGELPSIGDTVMFKKDGCEYNEYYIVKERIFSSNEIYLRVINR